MEVLQKLLKDPVIQQCRLRRDGDEDFLASALPKATTTTAKPGTISILLSNLLFISRCETTPINL